VIAVTLLVGAAAGYGIVNRDELIEKVREVTLPLRHEDVIRQQAAEKNVPADLIAAVIYQESKFRDQTSSAGARGLMQITPATAVEIEKLSGGESFEYEDLADPELNIRYGTFYLRHLLDIYEDDVVAALAAYNAGPANAEEWGGSEMRIDDIEFAETRDYVGEVLDRRDEYRDNYADELGL
jgi:soluble lytic murein transglycosylase